MKTSYVAFLLLVLITSCGPRIYVDGKSSPATTKVVFVNGNTNRSIEYLIRVPYYTDQWVHVGREHTMDNFTHPVDCFTGFVKFEYYETRDGTLRGGLKSFTFFVKPVPLGQARIITIVRN
jgi:hypothetical protein